MRVLTAGDSNFYHCMTGLAQSVRKHYGQQLIVYDIGLTEEQRQNIDAEIRKIDIEADYSGYISHHNTNFIKTTHKPFCIKHYFENSSEPLIYADADCLFLEKVELDGFDVAVTVKPKRKRDTKNYFNGIINAGVIFFNSYPEKLVERWIQECSSGEHTDQSALAKILSETIDWKETGKVYDWQGLSVKTLPIETYNDYYLRSGKIFHFKGDRHEGETYNTLLTAINENRNPYSLFKRKTTSPFFRFLKSLLSPVKK